MEEEAHGNTLPIGRLTDDGPFWRFGCAAWYPPLLCCRIVLTQRRRGVQYDMDLNMEREEAIKLRDALIAALG